MGINLTRGIRLFGCLYFVCSVCSFCRGIYIKCTSTSNSHKVIGLFVPVICLLNPWLEYFPCNALAYCNKAIHTVLASTYISPFFACLFGLLIAFFNRKLHRPFHRIDLQIAGNGICMGIHGFYLMRFSSPNNIGAK
ncbi:hypothetical protein L211DRAFT_606410 [Terfezia boudieri ATCC MYA-4762]|uniref:Uncharacterized protein n=1 Tax=Terfezia boudieri ATCC MYA-4762 TaxID=1051890 RepID=A0A3N4LVZ5_9PEZI|nr:hypothetical protein L211DRAFT_606410 [Terfezia boudieri ATCC MYA-4762]